jgi:sulfate permease, SulP family
LRRYLPFLAWLQTYSRKNFVNDAVASFVVTAMLVPQGLAYAALAGMPPQTGLYASLLPLIIYAAFGSSRTLAVGPVAVISLMTAAAVSKVATPNTTEYLLAAAALAAMSGLILLGFGFLRLGFLANFLSRPVVSGFMTAAGILIAASQIQHVFGVSAGGQTLFDILAAIWASLGHINSVSAAIGLSSIAVLFWSRIGLKSALRKVHFTDAVSNAIAQLTPVILLVLTSFLSWLLNLQFVGLKLVGTIPATLPALSLPSFSNGVLHELILPAFMISVVGFVESASVARSLAARRREKVEPSQEFVGLGLANLASSVSGGFPVTGGIARSAVNFDAGAETQMAGVLTSFLMALAILFLTPLIAWLPQAVLSATIVVAVLSLVNIREIQLALFFSRTDFIAILGTLVLTLAAGIEFGIGGGVAISILLHLYNSSRPHIAEIGRVAETEHYRNVKRHDVETFSDILSIRFDESLYFANARYLEDEIHSRVSTNLMLRHVILVCPAINDIDLSALESLESIDRQLADAGIKFHLSEIKGPVLDKIKETGFFKKLSGNVYLTQHQAVSALHLA